MVKQQKPKTKRQHDIYLSGRELKDNVIVIKGNELTLEWINKGLLVWSAKDGKPDIITLLSRMENERSRMVKKLQEKGVHSW